MSQQEKAIAVWQLVMDYTFNYNNLAAEYWYAGNDYRWVNEAAYRDPVQVLNTLFGMCGEINGTFASLATMA
jgi:hypothetical protein